MASISFNEVLRESLAYRSRIARELAAAQERSRYAYRQLTDYRKVNMNRIRDSLTRNV